MNYKMLPHQEKTYEFIKRKKQCLIFSEAGTGKTLPVLQLIHENKGRTVYVCPAFLTHNIEKEIKKFFGDSLKCLIIDNQKSIEKSLQSDLIITSYERLRRNPEIFGTPNIVVFDEAHKITNRKSQITKLSHNLIDLLKATGKLEYLICMTATPLTNQVPDLFSLLALINYKNFIGRYKSFWGFCDAFCYKSIDRIRGRQVISYQGLTDKEALLKELKPVAIKYTLKEIGRLPETENIDIDLNVKITNSDAKKYDLGKAWEEYRDYEATGDEIEEFDNNYMRAKAFYAFIKAKGTIKFVENLMEENKDSHIIVLSCSIKAAKLIAEKFNCPCLHGGVLEKKRFKLADDFQEGKAGKVLVGTIDALGVGLTLTRANILVFNDRSWTPKANRQAVGRILRLNQEKNCLIYTLNANEIDRNINAKNLEKEKLIDATIEHIENHENSCSSKHEDFLKLF